MSETIFISGIDTDIGKTFSTGFIAKKFMENGNKTITQKLIQTGCTDVADDILKHREIMGIELNDDDKKRLTMPQIFTYPASPHLATKLDKKELDFAAIKSATEELQKSYDIVLLEGAGGLMVPLTEKYLTIEYIKDNKYPVILVTSGRLGSINHTILSLEAIKNRGIKLYALAFNDYDNSKDELIANDTKEYLKNYLSDNFPDSKFIIIPKL